MLRVFEAFAGYGSQSLALQHLNIEHEIVGISEINKYSIEAYNILHTNVKNYGDIRDIKQLPECDLLVYSFPCQDISVAGFKKGFSQEVSTRSSLVWEVHRLLLNMPVKPHYLLMENVKNIVSKTFMPDFLKWQKELEHLGYKNFYQVLDAADFNIPHKRERCFMLSILDENASYTFPIKQSYTAQLSDYINLNNTDDYIKNTEHILTLVNEFETEREIKHYNQNLQADKIHYIPCITPLRLNKRQNGRRFKEDNEPVFTITGQDTHGVLIISPKPLNSYFIKKQNLYYAIKIINAAESFKFMGLNKTEIEKIKASTIPKNKQTLMAGNSIVIPVLEAIFKQLFNINN